MSNRTITALVVSAVAGFVLLVGAGMAGGACHCMTPQFTLFPYGTSLLERFGQFGLALALLQFPLYVFILIWVRGTGWKVGVLLLLIALHVAAASLGLR